jgi:outer membrane protein OmpA-like peptidoglycan-associated protein
MVLLPLAVAVAQEGTTESSADVAFWVSFWARPRPIVFGAEEEAFYKNMKEVMFPWNDHEPANPSDLDSNAQWLKEHPNVHFYIAGFASSRGEIIYNLNLSQRRAEWVKQALISRGIPEDRVVMAVGWGQLYPVCPELNDECWSRNRLVRFIYRPS